MDPEEAIRRLRRGYDDFNRGDFDGLLAALDPEIEVRERPDAPDPRRASGRDEAVRMFRSLQEDFVEYRFEAREFHVVGDHVVAVVRQSGVGRISGVPVEGDIVHAWRVTEDDRVSGLHAFSTLEEALAAIREGG